MEAARESRLRHFPASWFATVMGLTGLALAWRGANLLMPVPAIVPLTLTAFAGAMFVLLAIFYGAKAIRYPRDVVAEWRHPVRVNSVPTFSIGLILLGTATMFTAPTLSFWLWAVGSALNLVLTLYVMRFWIGHTGFEIQHMNPAWFIPIIGNIVVPLAGLVHGIAEISWFFFSVGLVFWLVLFATIFYRIIFHDPLPERLVPTLVILIAPPAAGFLAYVTFNGTVDMVARLLYYTAVFLTMLLLTQIRLFARLQFFLSWWAYSFPLAALTIATLRMYQHNGLPIFRYASWGLLVLLTAIVFLLLLRTAVAVQRREIGLEER